MTPRNFHTFNPWGHVSRADRIYRQQVARRIHDDLQGKQWTIWERPIGPEDHPVRRLTTYAPYQWKALNHGYAYATQEEAYIMLVRLVGSGSLAIQEETEKYIEYQKDGMRYRLIREEAT